MPSARLAILLCVDRPVQQCLPLRRIEQAGSDRTVALRPPQAIFRGLSEVSVPTLVGGLAGAQGAPLGSAEIDVLTVALQSFQMRGAPMSGWLECSMRELVVGVYGHGGGRSYSLVAGALENLFNVAVTLPSFDAESGESAAGAQTRTRLVRSVVLRTEAGDCARHPEDSWSQLSVSREAATIKMQFEAWVVAAVRASGGLGVGFDVQRSLRGAAKTSWILMEALRFAPGDHRNIEEWRVLLDRSAYAAFGLNAARLTDSRAQLRSALDRICELDPTYVGYEFVPGEDPSGRPRWVLIVRRSPGYAFRRCRREQTRGDRTRCRVRSKSTRPPLRPRLRQPPVVAAPGLEYQHLTTVGVLVRKNAQAFAVKLSLPEVGVPAVVNGPVSVFATEIARDWVL